MLMSSSSWVVGRDNFLNFLKKHDKTKKNESYLLQRSVVVILFIQRQNKEVSVAELEMSYWQYIKCLVWARSHDWLVEEKYKDGSNPGPGLITFTLHAVCGTPPSKEITKTCKRCGKTVVEVEWLKK